MANDKWTGLDGTFANLPKEKETMKIPYIAYVAGIASCFVAAGVSCDHLNDFEAHPNQISGLSMGVTSAFIVLALYVLVLLVKKADFHL